MRVDPRTVEGPGLVQMTTREVEGPMALEQREQLWRTLADTFLSLGSILLGCGECVHSHCTMASSFDLHAVRAPSATLSVIHSVTSSLGVLPTSS